MRLNRVKIHNGTKELFVMVGRKRKTGKREKNGRIQREKNTDPKIISLTQPHRRGVPADKRHDQRAENPFGRLNLINAVTDAEYDAGIKYRDICLRYRAIISSPNPHPTVVCLDGRRYGSGAELTAAQIKTRRDEYMRAFEAIEGYGPRVVIKSVVIFEKELQAGDLPDLRAGLKGLVKHFGLARTDQRQSKRG